MKLAAANIQRKSVDLFAVSFLILFLELVCIRWFASTVVFLTFFTNIVLLATFVGMSVGCLAASSRRDFTRSVGPTLFVSVALAWAVLAIYMRFGQVMIDVGGQGSPQQIYFGTEYRARDVSWFIVPIEAVAGVFFLLIAFTFVGLGQTMGRAFRELPDRVTAYVVNIAGSLGGIAAVTVLSYWQTPPVVWFAVALALCLYFVPRRTPIQVAAAAGIMTVVAASGVGASETRWSPYYKIGYSPDTRSISTNNIGHQVMVRIEDAGAGYALPHLLNRSMGRPPFADVLVIGAGSGNDVAAALRYGAAHVDAVEIDPAIFELGRRDHPDRPYSDPRVTVHIDDGRAFLRRTPRRYDLIVYALVDSLVLQSGYSTVRLESFLFTRDAFADIGAHLKPDGLFAAYNAYRQGWVVGRLSLLMQDVFGAEPIVMALPYRAVIRPADPVPNITFMLGGRRSSMLPALSQRLERHPFWINNAPRYNEAAEGFGATAPSAPGPPPDTWHRMGPAAIELRATEPVPDDDWPFLYLRDAAIPAVNLRGIALIAGLSLGLLFAVSPGRTAAPNWPMFFMGAGFMLLETKSVVHLALLFGSTWIVNAVVVSSILMMILFSNVFVLAVRPQRLQLYYALLASSLVLGIAVPMNALLNLPPAVRAFTVCTIVFLPIFFGGIVFAVRFRDSMAPDVDFGSNIAGAVLGGLAEALSLVIGFKLLLLVAFAFYACSAIPVRSAKIAAVE